jgi:hemerythrin
MKWTDEYATGIPQIDEQHKMLFKMADDYRAALDEGEGERTYDLLLDFLERYTSAHFSFEERCMEEYRCPVAEKNKEAHAHFMVTLRDFKSRFSANRYRASDATALVETVEQWLAGHITRTDSVLRQYVEKD